MPWTPKLGLPQNALIYKWYTIVGAAMRRWERSHRPPGTTNHFVPGGRRKSESRALPAHEMAPLQLFYAAKFVLRLPQFIWEKICTRMR